jgi:hypothetical protein
MQYFYNLIYIKLNKIFCIIILQFKLLINGVFKNLFLALFKTILVEKYKGISTNQ